MVMMGKVVVVLLATLGTVVAAGGEPKLVAE